MSIFYYDVRDAGSIIFSLVFRVAIWAILNAVVFVAFDIALKNNTVREREQVKARITRVFFVTVFLLNVTGIAGCALQIGLDMF